VHSPAKFRETIETWIGQGRFGDAARLVEITDPQLLADAAIADSDAKIFMIAEDTIFAPGVKFGSYDESLDESAWEMPGTSDVLESRAQEAWHETARKFAEEYNVAILQDLRREKPK
jgi:hypothetical protein